MTGLNDATGAVTGIIACLSAGVGVDAAEVYRLINFHRLFLPTIMYLSPVRQPGSELVPLLCIHLWE